MSNNIYYSYPYFPPRKQQRAVKQKRLSPQQKFQGLFILLAISVVMAAPLFKNENKKSAVVPLKSTESDNFIQQLIDSTYSPQQDSNYGAETADCLGGYINGSNKFQPAVFEAVRQDNNPNHLKKGANCHSKIDAQVKPVTKFMHSSRVKDF